MINNNKKQYKKFNLYECFSGNRICHSNEYSDSIFPLVKPKIISNLINNMLTVNKSAVSLENNLIDVKSSNSNLHNVNRFDKKNKSNTHIEDTLDLKKKKNKLQKKSRKQIVLEGDNLFRSNNSNIIFNEENLNHDIIKVPKVNKNKKKNHIKSYTHSHDLSESVNKEVTISATITIQELSNKLNIPETEIITFLFLKGIPVTINQIIDIEIAREVALKYSVIIKEETKNDLVISKKINYHQDSNNNQLSKRPPIITILGHVDHGKTTLLNAILSTNVVRKESGGITQAIINYEVEWLYKEELRKLVFLDTPGHQAFSSIRMRGTQVTDLILLVVAADDGLKPQTIEAIQYIFEQSLPYIVVINKIDKVGINRLKVREELAKHKILDKSCGGNAIIVEVSALKEQNINLLLSNICILSDLQFLKANPNQLASGTLIEAYLDIQRGPVAIIVVQDGSLKVGQFIVAGNLYGKIKVILNNSGIKLQTAGPSSIVQVLGFSNLPEAGESFHIVNNKKDAEYSINNYQINNKSIKLNNLNNRITLESTNKKINLKNLNIILKSDSQGSSEAIINAFNTIPQNKVQLNILQISFGNISRADIELASTSNSKILGFNVNISSQACNLAKQLNISVNTFNIIYNLIDEIIDNMLNLVEPEYDEFMIGKAIVKNVFYINKGSVAGCTVTEGKLIKGASLNVYRNSQIVYTSILNSLKRMKDDVNEVLQSNECGVMCYDYNLWNVNDTIEAYELKEKE